MDNHSEEENSDWNRFGATSLIQKNHTIGENVWKIGMITNGGRNRKIWIAERKWRSGRNWVKR